MTPTPTPVAPTTDYRTTICGVNIIISNGVVTNTDTGLPISNGTYSFGGIQKLVNTPVGPVMQTSPPCGFTINGTSICNIGSRCGWLD